MKKDKEIVLELESQVREINHQFLEQLRALDTRLEIHVNMIWELSEFYKKQSEAEAEYGKNLEKLGKQISLRHKDNKQKREGWLAYSTFNAWQKIVACTKEKGRDHTALSDVINNHIISRLFDINEDMQRIHKRCKDMIISCQDDIKKVLNELVKSMKTYQLYHGESQVAESKLLRAQSQRVKVDQQNLLAKKFVNYEKRSEKKQAKYTENKLKALRARNDYLLNIDTANVALSKYFNDDFPRLIQKMDGGFQNMLSRVLEHDITSHKTILHKDETRADILQQSALGIQGPNDYLVFKHQWTRAFNQPHRIQFQAHKGDEVSQLSAQKLVQEEMVTRMDQVNIRIQKIKQDKEEMKSKICQGEELFFERLKGQQINVEAYFIDTISVKSPTDKNKDGALKNEDSLFELYKDNLMKGNLLHRLQAKHELLRKALGEGVNIDCKEFFFRPPSLPPKPKKKSKTSKSRPSLFGGDIEEYVKATGEHIPNVMKSCIHVINTFGMHHQGIFRVSGSVSEMGNYKALFEKGEDPLQDKMDGDDINTVAGLLKLYFRDLKQPLFTFDLYDALIKCSQTVYASTAVSSSAAAATTTAAAVAGGGGGGGGGGESVPESDWKAMLSRLLSALSPERIVIMRFLFAFLNHVTEHSDENMMEAFNLSICFGPTLLYAPPERTDQHQFQNYVNDLIKNIIVHQDELFPPPNQEDHANNAVYEKYYLYYHSDKDSDDDALKDPLNEEDDELDKHEALVNEDYTAQSENDISVSRGDIVQLLSREGDQWMVEGSGRLGLVPDRILTYGKGGTLFRYTKASRDKSTDYLNQSNSSIHKSSSHSNLLTQSDDTSANQSGISGDSSNHRTGISPTNDVTSPWQQQQQQILVPVLPPLPRLSFRARPNSSSPIPQPSSNHQTTHPPSPSHQTTPPSELDIQVSPPTSSLDIRESSSSPHHPSTPVVTDKFAVEDKSSLKDETLSLGRASFNMKLLQGNNHNHQSTANGSSRWRSLPHGVTPPKSKNVSNTSFKNSHQTTTTTVPSTATNSPAHVVKTTLGSSVSLNNNLFRHQQPSPKQQSTTTTATTTTATTNAAATLPRINEKLSAPPAVKVKPVIRKRVSAEGMLATTTTHSPLTTTSSSASRVVDEAPSVKPSKIFQNVQQQKQQLLLQHKQQQQSSLELTPGSTFSYKKPTTTTTTTTTTPTTNNNNNKNNNNNNNNNTGSTFKTIDNINASKNDGFNNSERNQFSSFKISSKK